MELGIILAIIGTILCLAAAGGMVIFYLKLAELGKSIKKTVPAFAYVYEHRSDVEKFARDFDEILRGGNKINQDAVDINRAMVREVSNVRKAVETLSSAVIQPPVDEVLPFTAKTVQNQYDYDYKALLQQGYDHGEAAIRAANWELERIADHGLDENMGIGA